jgi:type II restriction/modification system DNA methylase subunit YeeA
MRLPISFSWDAISPAIFGSLFQSVMQPEERRRQGAHYTTGKNILKVIEPLFLEDLRAEFTALTERRDSGRKRALEGFHEKLSNLRFFDPACGCGNFLIIAYRELRLLEIDLLKVLRYAKANSIFTRGRNLLEGLQTKSGSVEETKRDSHRAVWYAKS